MGSTATYVLAGLIVATLVAIMVMSMSGREGFEGDSDEAEALVFRVYMEMYGVPPPLTVANMYAHAVAESGIDESTLRAMIAANPDAAPDQAVGDMMADDGGGGGDMGMGMETSMTESGTSGGSGMEHYTPGTEFSNAAIEFGPGRRVVDCAGGKCEKGTNLHIWDDGGTANQRWSYDAGSQAVTSMGKCMDVSQSGKDNGTRVQSWDCNNGPAQKWVVQKNRGPGIGSVQLMNPNSGKCLDVTGGVNENGKTLQLWDCGQSGHSWDIRDGVQTDWVFLNGRAKRVSVDAQKVAVVNGGDEIFVADTESGTWSKKNGLLRHVSVSNGKAAGVDRKQ